MPGSYRSSVELDRRTFSRILLVKPSSLGDVVHALPVLHGLRARYSEAKIDWLIGSAIAPLVEGHEDVDELVLFDRGRFGRLAHSPAVIGEFSRFLRELRERRYDLVVDLQGLFRSGLLTWMTGAPVRIGFRDAREGAWAFYTHHIRGGDSELHAVDRNYRVAELLGFSEVPVRFKVPLAEIVRLEAETLLREAGVPGDERLLVIAPTARWETKVWAPERFAETIDRLQQDSGVCCVLVGGGDETDQCEQVEQHCRTKPVNLAGRTTLPQLAAVVRLADTVLCHDSAVAHLAVAFDRPLVCITGPPNPIRTGPYRRSRSVLRSDLDCSPCYLRRLRQCRYDHRCMKELTVDAVVGEVERALAHAVPEIA